MKALALKYRPKTFDDVTEQSSIRDILVDQLATGTHKNCYLFTGPAGCGKTTAARIFVNDLNKGKGSPIEIDAASNNGVEQVRQIIANASFKAIDSEYKAYIVDECHAMSSGAWQAMLKLIEEPPAYTVFIFCTTDPHKIPATILSRVQRYDFQRISFSGIIARLTHILENEDIVDYDQRSVDYIAKLADGGMRDSIMLLDKCLSADQTLQLDNVIAALGTVNYDVLFQITHLIVEGEHKVLLETLENLYQSGTDFKQFIKQYSVFVLDLCKFGLYVSMNYLSTPTMYAAEFDKFTDKEFFYFPGLLDKLIKLNGQIKWDASPKELVESNFYLWALEFNMVSEGMIDG